MIKSVTHLGFIGPCPIAPCLVDPCPTGPHPTQDRQNNEFGYSSKISKNSKIGLPLTFQEGDYYLSSQLQSFWVDQKVVLALDSAQPSYRTASKK